MSCRVKQVYDLGLEGDVHLAAIGQPGTLFIRQIDRRQAKDDVVIIIRLQVQMQFRTHHFIHEDRAFDRIRLIVEERGRMFRTDTQRDIL